MAEERTPKNAPGPFYVAKDQCITCMAPEAEAPMLMGFDEDAPSCYFRRQPETAEEVYRAMRALRVACCDALRYDGSDPEVARRLVVAGSGAQVDRPPEPGVPLAPCDRVTFAFEGAETPEAVASTVGKRMAADYPFGAVTEPVSGDGWASVVYSWSPNVGGLELVVLPSEEGGGRWLLVVEGAGHPALTAITGHVDDALRATGRASDVRWYTRADWQTDRVDWSRFPI